MNETPYTSFAKYPDEHGNEVVVKMEEIEYLITEESNKHLIAKIIYYRYFKRYLKPFLYKSTEYIDNYKNGFSMMTNFCLLIETLSSFLDGNNQTPYKKNEKAFETFFEKAEKYSNPLAVFRKKRFYNNVRCALLHQGETYEKVKIRRSGDLFDDTHKTINATAFCEALIDFLKAYRNELEIVEWNSKIWTNCRKKISHIVDNNK